MVHERVRGAAQAAAKAHNVKYVQQFLFNKLYEYSGMGCQLENIVCWKAAQLTF